MNIEEILVVEKYRRYSYSLTRMHTAVNRMTRAESPEEHAQAFKWASAWLEEMRACLNTFAQLNISNSHYQ